MRDRNHAQAVVLEQKFFDTFTDPKNARYLRKPANVNIESVYLGWWLNEVGDYLWARELAECSSLMMSAEDMLRNADDELGIGRDLWDGILEEGRKNLVEILERGGHGPPEGG